MKKQQNNALESNTSQENDQNEINLDSTEQNTNLTFNSPKNLNEMEDKQDDIYNNTHNMQKLQDIIDKKYNNDDDSQNNLQNLKTKKSIIQDSKFKTNDLNKEDEKKVYTKDNTKNNSIKEEKYSNQFNKSWNIIKNQIDTNILNDMKNKDIVQEKFEQISKIDMKSIIKSIKNNRFETNENELKFFKNQQNELNNHISNKKVMNTRFVQSSTMNNPLLNNIRGFDQRICQKDLISVENRIINTLDPIKIMYENGINTFEQFSEIINDKLIIILNQTSDTAILFNSMIELLHDVKIFRDHNFLTPQVCSIQMYDKQIYFYKYFFQFHSSKNEKIAKFFQNQLKFQQKFIKFEENELLDYNSFQYNFDTSLKQSLLQSINKNLEIKKFLGFLDVSIIGRARIAYENFQTKIIKYFPDAFDTKLWNLEHVFKNKNVFERQKYSIEYQKVDIPLKENPNVQNAKYKTNFDKLLGLVKQNCTPVGNIDFCTEDNQLQATPDLDDLKDLLQLEYTRKGTSTFLLNRLVFEFGLAMLGQKVILSQLKDSLVTDANFGDLCKRFASVITNFKTKISETMGSISNISTMTLNIVVSQAQIKIALLNALTVNIKSLLILVDNPSREYQIKTLNMVQSYVDSMVNLYHDIHSIGFNKSGSVNETISEQDKSRVRQFAFQVLEDQEFLDFAFKKFNMNIDYFVDLFNAFNPLKSQKICFLSLDTFRSQLQHTKVDCENPEVRENNLNICSDDEIYSWMKIHQIKLAESFYFKDNLPELKNIQEGFSNIEKGHQQEVQKAIVESEELMSTLRVQSRKQVLISSQFLIFINRLQDYKKTIIKSKLFDKLTSLSQECIQSCPRIIKPILTDTIQKYVRDILQIQQSLYKQAVELKNEDDNSSKKNSQDFDESVWDSMHISLKKIHPYLYNWDASITEKLQLIKTNVKEFFLNYEEIVRVINISNVSCFYLFMKLRNNWDILKQPEQSISNTAHLKDISDLDEYVSSFNVIDDQNEFYQLKTSAENLGNMYHNQNEIISTLEDVSLFNNRLIDQFITQDQGNYDIFQYQPLIFHSNTNPSQYINTKVEVDNNSEEYLIELIAEDILKDENLSQQVTTKCEDVDFQSTEPNLSFIWATIYCNKQWTDSDLNQSLLSFNFFQNQIPNHNSNLLYSMTYQTLQNMFFIGNKPFSQFVEFATIMNIISEHYHFYNHFVMKQNKEIQKLNMTNLYNDFRKIKDNPMMTSEFHEIISHVSIYNILISYYQMKSYVQETFYYQLVYQSLVNYQKYKDYMYQQVSTGKHMNIDLKLKESIKRLTQPLVWAIEKEIALLSNLEFHFRKWSSLANNSDPRQLKTNNKLVCKGFHQRKAYYRIKKGFHYKINTDPEFNIKIINIKNVLLNLKAQIIYRNTNYALFTRLPPTRKQRKTEKELFWLDIQKYLRLKVANGSDLKYYTDIWYINQLTNKITTAIDILDSQMANDIKKDELEPFQNLIEQIKQICGDQVDVKQSRFLTTFQQRDIVPIFNQFQMLNQGSNHQLKVYNISKLETQEIDNADKFQFQQVLKEVNSKSFGQYFISSRYDPNLEKDHWKKYSKIQNKERFWKIICNQMPEKHRSKNFEDAKDDEYFDKNNPAHKKKLDQILSMEENKREDKCMIWQNNIYINFESYSEEFEKIYAIIHESEPFKSFARKIDSKDVKLLRYNMIDQFKTRDLQLDFIHDDPVINSQGMAISKYFEKEFGDRTFTKVIDEIQDWMDGKPSGSDPRSFMRYSFEQICELRNEFTLETIMAMIFDDDTSQLDAIFDENINDLTKGFPKDGKVDHSRAELKRYNIGKIQHKMIYFIEKSLQPIFATFVNIDQDFDIHALLKLKYSNRQNQLLFDYLHYELYWEVLHNIFKKINQDINNHQLNLTLGPKFVETLIIFITKCFRLYDVKSTILERALPFKLKYLQSNEFNTREKRMIRLGIDDVIARSLLEFHNFYLTRKKSKLYNKMDDNQSQFDMQDNQDRNYKKKSQKSKTFNLFSRSSDDDWLRFKSKKTKDTSHAAKIEAKIDINDANSFINPDDLPLPIFFVKDNAYQQDPEKFGIDKQGSQTNLLKNNESSRGMVISDAKQDIIQNPYQIDQLQQSIGYMYSSRQDYISSFFNEFKKESITANILMGLHSEIEYQSKEAFEFQNTFEIERTNCCVMDESNQNTNCEFNQQATDPIQRINEYKQQKSMINEFIAQKDEWDGSKICLDWKTETSQVKFSLSEVKQVSLDDQQFKSVYNDQKDIDEKTNLANSQRKLLKSFVQRIRLYLKLLKQNQLDRKIASKMFTYHNSHAYKCKKSNCEKFLDFKKQFNQQLDDMINGVKVGDIELEDGQFDSINQGSDEYNGSKNDSYQLIESEQNRQVKDQVCKKYWKDYISFIFDKVGHYAEKINLDEIHLQQTKNKPIKKQNNQRFEYDLCNMLIKQVTQDTEMMRKDFRNMTNDADTNKLEIESQKDQFQIVPRWVSSNIENHIIKQMIFKCNFHVFDKDNSYSIDIKELFKVTQEILYNSSKDEAVLMAKAMMRRVSKQHPERTTPQITFSDQASILNIQPSVAEQSRSFNELSNGLSHLDLTVIKARVKQYLVKDDDLKGFGEDQNQAQGEHALSVDKCLDDPETGLVKFSPKISFFAVFRWVEFPKTEEVFKEVIEQVKACTREKDRWMNIQEFITCFGQSASQEWFGTLPDPNDKFQITHTNIQMLFYKKAGNWSKKSWFNEEIVRLANALFAKTTQDSIALDKNGVFDQDKMVQFQEKQGYTKDEAVQQTKSFINNNIKIAKLKSSHYDYQYIAKSQNLDLNNFEVKTAVKFINIKGIISQEELKKVFEIVQSDVSSNIECFNHWANGNPINYELIYNYLNSNDSSAGNREIKGENKIKISEDDYF